MIDFDIVNIEETIKGHFPLVQEVKLTNSKKTYYFSVKLLSKNRGIKQLDKIYSATQLKYLNIDVNEFVIKDICNSLEIDRIKKD